MNQIAEIGCGRRYCAGDNDGFGIGGAAGVSRGIGLLRHIIAGFDPFKRIGAVHQGGDTVYYGTVGIFQGYGHACHAALTVPPDAVAVHIVKDHTGYCAFFNIPETCRCRALTGHTDGFSVDGDTHISVRVRLLNRIISGADTVEFVRTVKDRLCLACLCAVSAEQFHHNPADPGFVRILFAVAVQVLKDRAGNFALYQIPEIGD